MIIAVGNFKGGCGKSTTASVLAQMAVADGLRVLAVDLDPQANMSAFLGAAPDASGAFTLIEKGKGRIQHSEQGMDVVGASYDLVTLKTAKGSAHRLGKALEPIRAQYDVIILDTPPGAGESVYNALAVADRLIVPVEADQSSLQGLYMIADLADRSGMTIDGVLVTKYDARGKLNVYLRDAVKAAAEKLGAVHLGEVRNGIAVKEAQAMQKALPAYAPKAKPTDDYRRIWNTVKGWCE